MVLPFIAQVSLSMSRQPAAPVARVLLRPLHGSLTAAQQGCRGHAPSTAACAWRCETCGADGHTTACTAAPVWRLQQQWLLGQSAQPSEQQLPLFWLFMAIAGPTACLMALSPPPQPVVPGSNDSLFSACRPLAWLLAADDIAGLPPAGPCKRDSGLEGRTAVPIAPVTAAWHNSAPARHRAHLWGGRLSEGRIRRRKGRQAGQL